MKIQDAKTFVVGNPPPHFGGLYWVFVKLTTDSGTEGYGEVYSVPFHPRVLTAMIEDVCDRCVIGADPFKIERLWRIVYSSGYTQRSGPAIMGVLSGIETACWDIIGKELGRPVYDLLGGQVRERLRSYTYIYPETAGDTSAYTDPDVAAERAAAYEKTEREYRESGVRIESDHAERRRSVETRSERDLRGETKTYEETKRRIEQEADRERTAAERGSPSSPMSRYRHSITRTRRPRSTSTSTKASTRSAGTRSVPGATPARSSWGWCRPG